MLDLCHNDIGFKGASALAKCLQQRCLGGSKPTEDDWHRDSMFLIFWTSKQPVAFFKGSNFGKSVKTWPAKKKFPGLMDHKILGWNTACFASNNNLGSGKKKPNLSCLKKWLPPEFSVEQIEWFQFQRMKEIPGIRVDGTSPSAMEHPQVRWNIPQVRWNIPNWNQF